MVIYAVAAACGLASTQFWPDQNLPTVSSLIKWWDWKMWVILALLLVAAAAVEGAYRHSRKSKQVDARTDEAGAEVHNRRKALTNRDELARAMAEARQTGVALVMRLEQSAIAREKDSERVNVHAASHLLDLKEAYGAAMAELDRERSVAGPSFRASIDIFAIGMERAIGEWERGTPEVREGDLLRSSAYEFDENVRRDEERAIRAIDMLAHGEGELARPSCQSQDDAANE